MSARKIAPETTAARTAYSERVAGNHLHPLWEVFTRVLTPEPQVRARPAHWRYDWPMRRAIISLFLVSYSLSGLTAAMEMAAWLDPAGEHYGHEMHLPAHDSAGHDDELGHHFCHHNLLGLAVALPAPEPPRLRGGGLCEPPELHQLEFPHRLLRPPRL